MPVPKAFNTILAIGLFLSLAGEGRAITYHMVQDGNYNAYQNWEPLGVPANDSEVYVGSIGENSAWENRSAYVSGETAYAGTIYVGNSSGGTLSVLDGGTMSSSTGYIAFGAGSTGKTTVDASTWTNAETGFMELHVGFDGVGELSIRNGGFVGSAGSGHIGYNAGSSGTVTIDATSRWSTNVLYVGFEGDGTLSVGGGGTLSHTSNAYIASGTASTGSVTVDASTWSGVGKRLYVGSGGVGSFTARNGSAISNDRGYIGWGPGSSGSVTVESKSTWTNTGTLYLGDSGAGALLVQSGGTVSSKDAYIANKTGGSGTATVRGANSTWSNSGTLRVGYKGAGTLNLVDGGTLIADSVLGGSAIATINFDGGILKPYTATTTTASWLTDGTNAASGVFIKEGGATFDVREADTGIVVPLQHGGDAKTDGGLTKTGAGTLTLSGDNDYTGLTKLDSGVLKVKMGAKNALLNLGGVDVRGGRLVFDYYGEPESPVDAIRANLRSSFVAGGGSLTSGMMFTSTGSAQGYGLGYADVFDDEQHLGYVAVEIALYGDLDLNGVVDLGDLTLMGQNWLGADKLWEQGDVNYDGTVDLGDLTLMGQNWLHTFNGSSMSGLSFHEAARSVGLTPVPEPAGLALLALAASGLAAGAWIRRKRPAFRSHLFVSGDGFMKNIAFAFFILALAASSARAEVIGAWSKETASENLDRWILTVTPKSGEVLCGFDVWAYDVQNRGLLVNNGNAFGNGIEDYFTSFLLHSSHEAGDDDIADLLVYRSNVNENRLRGEFAVTTNSGASYAAGFSGPLQLLELIVPTDAIGSWEELGLKSYSDQTQPAHYSLANGFVGEIVLVPEPSTLALLAAGLVGLLAYAWRRRR